MRVRRQIVSETYLSVSRRICWANRGERGGEGMNMSLDGELFPGRRFLLSSLETWLKKHSFLVPFHFPLALVILALIRLDDGPGICSDLL